MYRTAVCLNPSLSQRLCTTFCPNCGKSAQCSAFTDVGRRWLGTTCCEWIAAHIHRSFVDQGDKAGAHSMTGRPGLGNGGQETAALRPRDSAESNEGQLSPRIQPKPPWGGGGGGLWNNNLGGQISCLTIVADIGECGNRRQEAQMTRKEFEGGFDSRCSNLTPVRTGTITQTPDWNAWTSRSAFFSHKISMCRLQQWTCRV